MDVKKTLTILLFFWLSAHFVSGQMVKDTSNFKFTDEISEKIILFADRDFYLSGEEIWFVAYSSVNNKPFVTDFSQVLYVELISSDQKAIVKNKFKIEGGIAKGNFGIPEEALSGNYSLRAYTRFLRNIDPDSYFTSPITVINPERPLPEQGQKLPFQELKNDAEIPVEIAANTSKKSYQQRELVDLTLSVNTVGPQDFVHVSVSVVKQGTLKDFDNFYAENSRYQKINPSENLLWLPEIRDVSISGIIRNKKTNLPETNAMIYISVLGENLQFHIINSRKNGEFVFSLNHVTGLRDVFICAAPDPEKDFELLINNDFAGNYPTTKESNAVIDTSYKKFIEEMYVNFQAASIYEIKDSASHENSTAGSLIFGNPEISVKISDFIELPTLEDVFKELVTAVSIKKKKGKSYFQVINAETSRMNNCEFVFLDNVPVFDVDALLKIPPSKIERIDVINRTHYLGDFSLDGIILIWTNTDNFAGFTFPKESVFLEYQAITEASDFTSPDYSNADKKQSRLPDFRTLLYWNPEVSLQNGKASFSFYTSDYCAGYDVIVRGITPDGKFCFGKTAFRVEPAKK